MEHGRFEPRNFLSSSSRPSRVLGGTVGRELLIAGLGLGPVVIRTGSGMERDGTKGGGGWSYRELPRHGRPNIGHASRYIDTPLEAVLVYR
jgi:hypothetical protein